tara:strand:+ start:3477 stop:3914 length:438 start_codon:yes stop_codon:yes gene_type:complete
MEKTQKKILIGILLALVLYYFFGKDKGEDKGYTDFESDLNETGGGSSGGSGGGGSGGSGAPSTGTDSTDDQVNDPTSPFTDYVQGGGGPTAPFVGDIASGSSGKPSLGKPTKPYISKPAKGKGFVSQQKLIRGSRSPKAGFSYFK